LSDGSGNDSQSSTNESSVPVNTDKILKDGEKAVELDPSKLQYKNTQGKVVLHNKDSYTRKMSIMKPYQVAVAIKLLYKSELGKDLDIRTESLALEIYAHAILFDNGMFTTHTNNADCGESRYDWNRFIWDTWSADLTQRLR